MGIIRRDEPGASLYDRGVNTDNGGPLVSIISAFYNAAAHLEQTFRCVVNQTFPWFEWIIVNDGSTDAGQVDFLYQIAQRDPRIRLIERENGGLARARNTAIENARSEIIIPLDCDDLITPIFVEMTWWVLHEHPEAAWAYTDTVGFGSQSYVWKKKFDANVMKTDNLLVATAAIRRSALAEVGGYDCISRHFFEDWALWLKLMGKGCCPVHIGENAFWYRRSDKGELSQAGQNQDQKAYLQQLAQNVDGELKAIEYPRSGKQLFASPQRSDFSRRLYQQHDRTRLLLILPWLEVGGADIFNCELVSRLDPERYQITIVTTLPAENRIRDRFECITPEVYPLPSFMDACQYPEFISYLMNSREIDVVLISNSSHGYGMAPWLRAQYPQAVILDYVHMEEWYWRNGGYARQSALLGDVLEMTCVCNGSTERVMTQRLHRAPQSVETVYIGVDEQKFCAQNVDESSVYGRCGIDRQRPTVLFPCRLNAQKRPYMMLEIAGELSKRLKDVVFLVVGDGPEGDGMRSAISRRHLEDTVRMIGYESDLRPYYKAADVTLICSLKEGLALTAYESCAMGTPVVSSDVGGQREMIDEQVGAIIPLIQSEAKGFGSQTCLREEVLLYVDALERILTDESLRAEMGRRCRERIEERFTIARMVQNMDSLIQRLIADPDREKRRAEKSTQLRMNMGIAEDYYVKTVGFEDMDTMQWLLNRTGTAAALAQAEEQPVEGEVRILSPSMARLVDRLLRISNQTWYGPRIKKALRHIKHSILRQNGDNSPKTR